jgi:hypothetical protein
VPRTIPNLLLHDKPVLLANMRSHGQNRVFVYLSTRKTQAGASGNIISSATADPIRLVQEELSVAERGFGVLINRHDDCLDVVIAPTLARS